MSKRMISAFVLAAALLLSACATPKIDGASFPRPKTVVIKDFPDMVPAATIEILVTMWPHHYFSGAFDRFYVVNNEVPGQRPIDSNIEVTVAAGAVAGAQSARNANSNVYRGAAVGGAIGGVVGAMIEAGAEATQKKAAEFPALFQKTMPGVNLRVDLLKALKAELEAKGMQVTIDSNTRNVVPRLLWPANTGRSEVVPGTLAEHPAIDADVVVQLAPMAVYAAPGPLNNYDSEVGIAVAMYNGRSREFLGWQALPSKQNSLLYARYDSLVADLAQAGPAQYDALMSLVPQVANVISGESK